MKPNIPTMLTWLRILLIPVFVGAFYWPENLHKLSAMPSHWVNVFATSVFAIAAITDWLDGYLARRLNQTSAFGAFLDPVADKLMVAAALIVLVEFGRVGAIVSLIIIGREIAISALREWMAELGKRANIAVSYVGKVKTALQMVSITILLAADGVPLFTNMGLVSLYLAAVLTIWSMLVYLKAAWPELKGRG